MMLKRTDELQVGDQIQTPEGRGTLCVTIHHEHGVFLWVARNDGDEIVGADANLPADSMTRVVPGFGCPHCLLVSQHPDDIETRYCGNCHVFWPKFPGVKPS